MKKETTFSRPARSTLTSVSILNVYSMSHFNPFSLLLCNSEKCLTEFSFLCRKRLLLRAVWKREMGVLLAQLKSWHLLHRPHQLHRLHLIHRLQVRKAKAKKIRYELLSCRVVFSWTWSSIYIYLFIPSVSLVVLVCWLHPKRSPKSFSVIKISKYEMFEFFFKQITQEWLLWNH